MYSGTEVDIYKKHSQNSPDVPSSPATLTAYQLPQTPPKQFNLPRISNTPPSPASNFHHISSRKYSISEDRLMTPPQKQKHRSRTPHTTSPRRSKPTSPGGLARRGTIVVPHTDGRAHYSNLFGERLDMSPSGEYGVRGMKNAFRRQIREEEEVFGELDGFSLAETDDPFFMERDSDTEGVNSGSSLRSYVFYRRLYCKAQADQGVIQIFETGDDDETILRFRILHPSSPRAP